MSIGRTMPALIHAKLGRLTTYAVPARLVHMCDRACDTEICGVPRAVSMQAMGRQEGFSNPATSRGKYLTDRLSESAGGAAFTQVPKCACMMMYGWEDKCSDKSI